MGMYVQQIMCTIGRTDLNAVGFGRFGCMDGKKRGKLGKAPELLPRMV